jgi:hypothetical protein
VALECRRLLFIKVRNGTVDSYSLGIYWSLSTCNPEMVSVYQEGIVRIRQLTHPKQQADTEEVN